MTLDLERAKARIRRAARPFFLGGIADVSGLLVEARGVPAAMGELCRIQRGAAGPVDAEVVGFRDDRTLLMPHADVDGIAPRQEVIALGRPFRVDVGDALLGRVVDGFGRPIDGGAPIPVVETRRVREAAPSPLSRPPIREALRTGVRAIDAGCTLGRGQRLGIFSGSGAGKSTLLAQIAKGTDADVVVVGLVGERGREVSEFLDDVFPAERRGRAVAVVATSDRPPIERWMAPFVAVTCAEYFRDRGASVLVVMDSVTRFAAACREIGLAAGEPPTVRGYPPSFFATVPKLVERMGNFERGSITGLLTILLDGDDPDEPVADTLRGLLDGHVLLDRELAHRGHFPAIDLLASLSRLMPNVAPEAHRGLAQALRRDLATWRDGRDLVEIGAYRPGANPSLDDAMRRIPAIEAFLRQSTDEISTLEETLLGLASIYAPGAAAGARR